MLYPAFELVLWSTILALLDFAQHALPSIYVRTFRTASCLSPKLLHLRAITFASVCYVMHVVPEFVCACMILSSCEQVLA
jgi:hypothetical protein